MYDALLEAMTNGAIPGLNGANSGANASIVGKIQAQKPQPVPYADPPAASLGPMSQLAYSMAGPAPQTPQPPPMMGIPNRPGLPGGPSPLRPSAPAGAPNLPMRNPAELLQLLRGGRMGMY